MYLYTGSMSFTFMHKTKIFSFSRAATAVGPPKGPPRTSRGISKDLLRTSRILSPFSGQPPLEPKSIQKTVTNKK